MIIQFVVGVFSARYLGPENYGTINYVASFLSFFTSLCGLGLNGVIINEFINHKDEEGQILGTAILMRFAVSLLSVFSFIFLVYLLDGRNESVILWVAVLQAVQLPFAAFDTVNYWYQSKLLSKYASIFQTVAYSLVAAYKIILLITRQSIYWFAFSSSLDIILLSVLYYVGYQKHKTQKLDFSKDTAKRILKNCYPFILANLMIFIYSQTDRIMIKQMLDSTVLVGFYSASAVITTIISFIPTSFIDSARPVIMESKSDAEQYQLRLRQTVAFVSWISFLYGVFIVIFARFVVLLLYGNAFLEAVPCLRIMVWADAFSFIGGIRSIWLICEKKNNYVWILSAIGALTNVILNLILIPLWGVNGAAFATLMTQLLSNVVYPLLFKDTRGFSKVALQGIFLRRVGIVKIFLQ